MSSLKELQDLIFEKYNLSPEQLDPNASMREHGLDSLALAEFLFEVEDRLHLTLPDMDQGVDSLAKLAELVDAVRAGLPVEALAKPAAAAPADQAAGQASH
jgi:acyl carrier protein